MSVKLEAGNACLVEHNLIILFFGWFLCGVRKEALNLIKKQHYAWRPTANNNIGRFNIVKTMSSLLLD